MYNPICIRFFSCEIKDFNDLIDYLCSGIIREEKFVLIATSLKNAKAEPYFSFGAI